MSKSRPTQRRTQSTSASPRRSPARKKKQSPATMIAVLVVVLAIGVLVFNAYSRRIDPALAKVHQKYQRTRRRHPRPDRPAGTVTRRSRPTPALTTPNGRRPAFTTTARRACPQPGARPHHYPLPSRSPDGGDSKTYILSLTRAHTHNWAAVLAVPRPNTEHPFVWRPGGTSCASRSLTASWSSSLIDAFIGRGLKIRFADGDQRYVLKALRAPYRSSRKWGRTLGPQTTTAACRRCRVVLAGIANRFIGTVYRVLLVRAAGKDVVGLLRMTMPSLPDRRHLGHRRHSRRHRRLSAGRAG